jgi:hypothetical protein
MKFLIEGSGPKKRRTSKRTTRVNMNTVRHKTSPSKAAVAIPASSSLRGEFNNIRRQAKRMPETKASEIEDKIKLWQGFVDKNKAEHADDPKMKQAIALIKNLKMLKSMY